MSLQESPPRASGGISQGAPAVAKPPPSRSCVRLVDMNELQVRLDKAAHEIAARVDSDEVRDAARKHSLAVLIRRTLTATVTDIFSDPERRMARPRYRGVREDGNPVGFLARYYKALIEKAEFFQADLARCDPKLLHALRNASKSKYWGHVVVAADAELLAHMGPGANMLFGARIGAALSLADLLPPRKNLDNRVRARGDSLIASEPERRAQPIQGGRAWDPD